MKTKIIIALVIFSASLSASAQTTAPTNAASTAKISTIKNDRTRIKQGVKSGELTKRETAKLKAETARVAMERKDYKQDGVISPLERKDLRKDKKQLSRNIYRQKHDRQERH